jgi:hypothetical protein
MKHFYQTIIALFFFSLSVSAQRNTSNFFEILNESQITLKENQQKKHQTMVKNDFYNQVTLVRIRNVTSIPKSGALPISIPGRIGTLVAHAQSVIAESDSEYVWIGGFEEAGTVTIIAKEGRIFGHIAIENDAYEIHDLGDKMNVLVKINNEKFTEKECATKDLGNMKETFQEKSNTETYQNKSNDEMSTNSTTSHGLSDIRILVLFTPNAADAVPNISDMAELSVQQINTALANSSVDNLRVSLAGVQQLNFNETSDITSDVKNLANNYTAQTHRNNFEADVVILFTNGNYGSTFGIVADIGPINALAYGIVQANAAAGRFTFAHEFAHLVGARHDNDPNHPYAHGHNFLTGTSPFQITRRTILNTLPAGESRILFFSNPDIRFENVPTGTNERNNARQLREQGHTVADFRNLTLRISGPRYGDNSGTYTWEALVSNYVNAPYSYLWEYSYDQSRYSWFGNTQSVTRQLPYDRDLYLRCTVTDVNGRIATAHHFTSNNSGDDCIKCTMDEGESPSYVIYPNPSADIIHILFETGDENTPISLFLYDLTGSIKLSKQLSNLEAGSHNHTIDVSDLRAGVYVLYLQTGSGVKTKRLMISR